jgi:hypothetical protein
MELSRWVMHKKVDEAAACWWWPALMSRNHCYELAVEGGGSALTELKEERWSSPVSSAE